MAPQQARQCQTHAQDISVAVPLVALIFHDHGAAAVRKSRVDKTFKEWLAGMRLNGHWLHDCSKPAGGKRTPAPCSAGRAAIDADRGENPQRYSRQPTSQQRC